MFIIELTYKAPLEEVDKCLKAHREFLDDQYRNGLILASGPMNPRTGGIIIAFGRNQAELEMIFKQDPFALLDIADYRFIEFTPIKHCKELSFLIEKMEGEVC